MFAAENSAIESCLTRPRTGGLMPSKLLSTSLPIPALIVVLHLLGSAPALAQVRITTLDELRRELSRGDVVSLVQTTGDAVKGRLLRVGDADIDIRIETQPRGQERRHLDITVPLSAIQSLDRPRDSSRNGALIGAGIGGGVTLGMFVWAVSVDRNEIDEWGSIYLGMGVLYTGIGALTGWAIDAAHSKRHIRFDAPSTGTMTIRVAPLLSRARGMSVVVAF